MIRAFPATRFLKFQDTSGYKNGVIDGVLSSFNNTDADGDVILPGAFNKFMEENDSVPMLWGHSRHDPIGKWTDFKEDGDLFRAKGELLKGIQRADEAKILFENKLVEGLSIAIGNNEKTKYKTVYDKNLPYGLGYVFSQIDLKEGSIVLHGANENAVIAELKSQLKTAEGEIDARAVERFLKTFGGLSRTEASEILNPYRESLKVERLLSGVVKDSAVSDSGKSVTGALLELVN